MKYSFLDQSGCVNPPPFFCNATWDKRCITTWFRRSSNRKRPDQSKNINIGCVSSDGGAPSQAWSSLATKCASNYDCLSFHVYAPDGDSLTNKDSNEYIRAEGCMWPRVFNYDQYNQLISETGVNSFTDVDSSNHCYYEKEGA